VVSAATLKISMREFLRSGAFGPIAIGTSRERVRAVLGQPDAWSALSRRERLPAIWKYGVVEFHFRRETDTIWLIHADDFDNLHLGGAADLDAWWMSRSATLEQAREELAAAHITVEPVNWPFDDGTIRLRVGAGTKLVFAREPPQLFLLFSHTVAPPTGVCGTTLPT
jgi:hypothetical protein